jgi:hypothetical protein
MVNSFKGLKQLTDHTFQQLKENDFHFVPGPESNSISVIMKHMAGNMVSRWTDFLTSDGEKELRNRDSEFVDEFKTNDELKAHWEKGWKCLSEYSAPLGKGEVNESQNKTAQNGINTPAIITLYASLLNY